MKRQYVKVSEDLDLNQESLDEAIHILIAYRNRIRNEESGHEPKIHYEIMFDDWGRESGYSSIEITYSRPETDEERDKRLIRERKNREREKQRKKEMEAREREQLELLKKKYGESSED